MQHMIRRVCAYAWPILFTLHVLAIFLIAIIPLHVLSTIAIGEALDLRFFEYTSAGVVALSLLAYLAHSLRKHRHLVIAVCISGSVAVVSCGVFVWTMLR